MESVVLPIESLAPHPANPNRHPDTQLDVLDRSLGTHGQQKPVVIWGGGLDEGGRDLPPNTILAGEGLWRAARRRGDATIICWRYSGAHPTAFLVMDNRAADLSVMDDAALADLLREVAESGALEAAGYTDADLLALLAAVAPADHQAEDEAARATLAERFVVPPFSIFDARQGYWQERKRAWVAIGVGDHDGRAERLTFSTSAQPLSAYAAKQAMEAAAGRSVSWQEFQAAQPEALLPTTSIFDPVLCEVAYRWFCPEGGRVLDPFAGGAVRGIVAGWLGLSYVGIDLQETQVAANQEAVSRLCPPVAPQWVVGDSLDVASLAPGQYDLLFSCPPYADLERYSDDPRDLSTMPYAEFMAAYRTIIASCCAHLADDRFAVFVVGDIRDARGCYRNFVGDTVAAFRDAGCALYNEAVFITPAGSLPTRAASMFQRGRKLGKSHQNVLVFYKGDPRRIAEVFGPVVCGDVPTASAS